MSLKRCFFEKNGLYYTAMAPTAFKRRRDMSIEDVQRRESNAIYFLPGWDWHLARLGVYMRLDYRGVSVHMIETEGAALVLGCRPGTVLKYLENARHLRVAPAHLRDVPLGFGFVKCRHRQPITMQTILGTSEPTDAESEIVPYEANPLDHCCTLSDDTFELPEPNEP